MATLTDLEKVRKSRARRRTIRNLLALAVVGILVYGAVILVEKASELDLQSAYGDLKAELATGAGYPVDLPGGKMSRLANVEDSIVLLSDTNIYTYNSTGKQLMNEQHGMGKPVLVTGKKKMILYDRGGKKFALYSRTGLVNTIDMENMIYAGDLAENGNYAVATGASEYAAQIIAFNKNDEEIFRFSSKEPIIDFTLSDNRNSMAVATVDVQDGQFKSTLSQYQFNVEQKLNSFDLMDELILSVEALENNMIRIITDKRAILMDDNLKELSDVSYNNKPLDRIAGELGSRLVFVLGSYDQQKELSCEVYDQWLNLLGEFPIDHSITDLEVDEQYIYLLSKDQIEICSYDGQPAAQIKMNNVYHIQPIGETLYYCTNDIIDTLNITKLCTPASSDGEKSSQKEDSSSQRDEEEEKSQIEASSEDVSSSEEQSNSGEDPSSQRESLPEPASAPEQENSDTQPSSSQQETSSGPLLDYDNLEPEA